MSQNHYNTELASLITATTGALKVLSDVNINYDGEVVKDELVEKVAKDLTAMIESAKKSIR